MSQTACRMEVAAESFHYSSCKSSRTFDRDLLPKNGTDRELETIPTARHSEARVSLKPLAQSRIASQAGCDHLPVRIQIEDPPYAFDDKEERTRIAKMNAHRQCVIILLQGNFDVAVEPVHGNGPTIAAGLHQFNSGGSTGC